MDQHGEDSDTAHRRSVYRSSRFRGEIAVAVPWWCIGMGAVTGMIDAKALSRLARGENATRLAEIIDEVDRPVVQFAHRYGRSETVELRRYVPPEDDDSNDDLGYYVYAGAARAVAIAHREVAAVRWVYLGKTCERVDDAYRVALFTSDNIREWDERWREPAIVAAADGVIRVVEWAERSYVKGIVVDRSEIPIALYLGLDAENSAVALVFDACGLGGIRDDRDGDENLYATQRALAVATPGACGVPARHRFEQFMPNFAEGVPLFDDDVYLSKRVEVTATLVGTLPLPSRTLGIRAGHERVWPVAADLIRVFAFVDAQGGLAAWMLRVDNASPVQWLSVGFGEDCCSIGDAGGTDHKRLEVIDGGWPRGVDLGFALNEAGAPLVCVNGPDLTQTRGAVGFDADGRMMTLVAIA